MQNKSIGHYPKNDKWTFDESVTDVFHDMLERSIPQYSIMRKAVNDLADKFIVPGSTIIDIGCSRGDAMKELVKHHKEANTFLGLEISDSMLKAAKERFSEEIKAGIVDIRKHDLRNTYPNIKASVTLSILTLQFTPIEYRQRIIQDIYDSTVSGGVFLIVEKVLGNTSEINTNLIEKYYDLKKYNGYSQEEIDRKRLSLEGVLVPVTAKWNEELLSQAGFKQIDCFWRWMNFAGWIAIKE